MPVLRTSRALLGLAVAVGVAPCVASAQEDFAVDAPGRATVVAAVVNALTEAYIFPDVAAAMNRDIRSRLERGEYDSVTSASAFATLLTSHLRAVSHDKHIDIEASAAPIPEPSTAVEPPRVAAERREAARRESAFSNFGFRRAERLRGNIGYLDLSAFERVAFGRETAVAAMRFVHNTDALIFDLRDNDGGQPDMVALLISYLVQQPTRLTGIYWRRDGRIAESRTVEIPDTLKYVGKRVYLLTSNVGTVSAAEAFAYDLQLLKRVTVVGETSAGAANAGGMVRLTEHFRMFVPTGRAVSPISGTNWEGTGIKPDIAVPAAAALTVAYLDALRSVERTAQDDERRRYLRSVIQDVEKRVP